MFINKKCVMRIAVIVFISIQAIFAGSSKLPPEVATWDMLTNFYLNNISATSELTGKVPHQYAPWRAIDGNSDTSWVEGKNDDGIGESIFIYDLLGKGNPVLKIGIWSGCAKNSEIFLANNRPHCVRIDFFDYDYAYNVKKYDIKILKSKKNINVISSYNLSLVDKNEMQYFDISEYGENNLYAVSITILSVYKGTKYRDTGISEIKLILKDGSDLLESRRKRWKGEFYPAGAGETPLQ